MSTGYISKIELENFMSHRKFEISLSPNMNIIVGRNGSGKSSILTALIVGLGGGARATGRGDNFKSLIRHGCKDAYIIITIRNFRGGPSLQRFGSVFTIQRRVGTKTSAYSIKDSDGKTISTKAQDVRNICFHFGFHPDNALVMLNQESAKEFLVTATPQVKYARLTKALQVDTFQKAMAEADSFIDHRYSLKDQVKKDYQVLQAKEKVETTVLENARQLQHSTSAISELKAVEAWRQVRKLEAKLATAKTAVQAAQTALSELSPIDSHDEIRRINEQLLLLEAEQHVSKSKEVQNAQQLQQHQKDVDIGRRKQSEAETALKRAKNDLDNAKNELEILLREQAPNAANDLVKLHDTLKELRNERAQLSNREESLEIEIQDLDSAHVEKTQEARSLAGEIKSIRASISEENSLLKAQQSGSMNPLIGFGPDGSKIRQLDRLIENQERNFKHKPVGPLARYMRCTDKKWAKLIETIARNAAWIYWVQDRRDRDLLQSMAKQVGLDAKITTLLWIPELFSYQKIPTSGEYSRFLDCVKFENEYIERIFVDQVSPEQDVFCESLDVAIEVSANAHSRYAYAENRRRDGWSRLSKNANGNRENRPVHLHPHRVSIQAVVDSPEAAKQVIRDRIQELKDMESTLNERKRAADADCKDLNKKIAALYAEKEKVVTNKISLDTRTKQVAAEIEKIEKADANEIDIETLSKNKEKAVRHRKLEVGSAENLVNRATKQVVLLQDAMNSQAAALEASKTETKEHMKQIKKLNADLQRLRSNQVSQQAVEAAAERKVTEAESQVAVLEQLLEDESEKAGSVGPRPDLEKFDDRDSSEIKSDIIRLEAQLEQLARSNIDLEKRESELLQLRDDIKKLYRYYKRSSAELKEFENKSKKRKLNAKEQFDLKMEQISDAYKDYIAERNFSGELIIDSEAKKLVATANPLRTAGESRSTTTLSGGEKSFTQICLLLSVWSHINTGLVAMDEYDVFMDEVFRAASMEALVRTITGKNAQGILITPQGLPKAIVEKYKDTDVFAVHNLENPR